MPVQKKKFFVIKLFSPSGDGRFGLLIFPDRHGENTFLIGESNQRQIMVL